jgi:hypothetical protein
MAIHSKQSISKFIPTVEEEAPAGGFYKSTPCTKDAGRVILGGACGGVKANNRNKLRA